MSRTTKDLVKELRSEADYGSLVALAVGFEHETKFIFSSRSEADALNKLNEFVKAGGEPIGLLKAEQHSKGVKVEFGKVPAQ
jgi:hypothetical protein